MTAINPSHNRELEELVSQPVQAFKNFAEMDDRDIFEYHLRYFRIMALYREMDRIGKTVYRAHGWLAS